jgi:hypothetical protein
MDRILKSFVDNFVTESGIYHFDGATAFEYFVNHTIISKIHLDPFDIEETSVGGGNDNALDGVAILVKCKERFNCPNSLTIAQLKLQYREKPTG